MIQPIRRQVLYLVLFFFTIYSLSFNGIPISDDEQLFAITARNIAVLKHFNAEPLYGDIRLLGQYQVEPLHPFLASIWYGMLTVLFNNNGLQIFFLLSVIYLSISAGLLFLLIVHFGYSSEFALEMVFWCGLSTIIWPYSKTFFREPLISMLLLASWLFFEKAFVNGQIKKIYVALFLAMVLALATTKLVYAAVAIPYLLMFFQNLKNSRVGRKIYLSVFISVLFFIGVFVYFIQTDNDVFYRYTMPALLEYWVRIISIPRENFFQTIFLALFSLWKGFFVYSPICAFVFFIPWANESQCKKNYLAFLPVFVFSSALLFQVVTYGDNPWTPPWSVRFLVPAVPLILIASLPALAHWYMLPAGKTWLRLIGAVGILIQLNAVLVNSSFYTRFLMEKSATFPNSEYWNIWSAPAFHQWQLLLDGSIVNLMIFRVVQATGSLPTYLLLLSGILLIIFLFLGLFYPRANSTYPFAFEITILSMTVPFLFLFVMAQDPFYTELTPLVEQVCQQINPSLAQDSLVIVQPYPSALWLTFANQDCLQGNWYSLPGDASIRASVASSASVNRLIAGFEKPFSALWLIRQTPDNMIVKDRLATLYPFEQMGRLDGPIDVEILRYEYK